MRAFAVSIVDTVRHPMLILGADLRVNAANPAFYRTFAATEAETHGCLIYDLGAGQWNVPRLRLLLEDIIPHNGSFEDFEIALDLPQHGRRVMLLSARQVRHDGNGMPMILLAVEDVTESRRIRGELHRLNQELERRVQERTFELEATNRELEAFCYSVSHDLRAPLRALDGFSNELLRSYAGQLNAKGRHYLERLRAGTQRMSQLIDDLLQLSRLSRSEMRRQQVDLSALVQAVAGELRRDAQREVTFSVEPHLSAWGDAALLRIALENLLANAWKFTSKRQQACIEFGRIETGSGPAFFLRDDGAGFDMAYAGKLFGAFQRLHSEREFPGNGIGLATVQRIVRRHGGRIWAEGEPEKGATFLFTLPCAAEAP